MARPAPEDANDALRLGELMANVDRLQDQFRTIELERNSTPGPSTSLEPQVQQVGDITVTVRPLRAEAQTWNAWPDGSARLFNDALGYLWEIDVVSPQNVRWDADHTSLAVNSTEQRFLPAPDAAAALDSLAHMAQLERRIGTSSDFNLRFDASTTFRQIYLSARTTDHLRGLLFFPAPAREIHATAMKLSIAMDVEGDVQGDRARRFEFLYE